MKQCAACGEFKSEEEYSFRYKAQGKRWGTCKECQKKQKRKWYERNKETHIKNAWENKKKAREKAREFIWDYLLTHPCIDCGESNPVVLEFDHVRGNKRMEVANMVRQGYAISTIQKEMDKCVVRCANCHRIKTHKKRGWWRR